MKKILIVDDDLDLLFCYKMMLKNGRNIVYATDSVYEALKIVREKSIDLAILDFMMPKMKGDALATAINQQDEDVKIIFISGYSEAVEAIKKLPFRVYGVFMKPINPEVMERMAEVDLVELVNDPLICSSSIPCINVF